MFEEYGHAQTMIIDTANAHAFFFFFLLFTRISFIYTYIVYIHERKNNVIKLRVGTLWTEGSYGISVDLFNKLKPLKRHDQAMKVLAMPK